MSLAGVTSLVTRVSRRKECQDYMALLGTRATEFDNDIAMRVAAIEMSGMRQLVDDGLQAMFEREPLAKFQADEVIIGSGWHADEWATTRVALGYPRPLVLEASSYPGGCFSVCQRPGFRANSRNRPGPLGLPGQGRGLNVLPGALVQPSVLNTEEFQGNDVLAYVNRLALACNARVRPNAKVVKIIRERPSLGYYQLKLESGYMVKARRIIDARGLGTCTQPKGVKCDGERVMDYNQFLARLDQPFPFKGWGRVAVVGAGDGANTVVEALLGIGPRQLSNTALDFVPEIDWYGPDLPQTKLAWSENTRCRYALIASYLPKEDTAFPDSIRDTRIEVINQRGNVVPGPGGAFVNDRFYDTVIIAIGFTPHKPLFGVAETSVTAPGDEGLLESSRYRPYTRRAPSVLCRKSSGIEMYRIGTTARIDFDSDAEKVTEFPQNKVAIFRLIGRTAKAAALAGPVPRGTPAKPTVSKKPSFQPLRSVYAERIERGRATRARFGRI